MGGIGSTRWADHTRKPLVEQAVRIDAKFLVSAPTFASGPVGATVECTAGPNSGCQVLITIDGSTNDGKRPGRIAVFRAGGDFFVTKVVLVQVEIGFSQRWYWACPAGCDRRRQALYLATDGREIACRMCLGLAYRSTQTWDSRISRLVRASREGDVQLLDRHTANTLRPGYRGLAAGLLQFRVMERLGLWPPSP